MGQCISTPSAAPPVPEPIPLTPIVAVVRQPNPYTAANDRTQLYADGILTHIPDADKQVISLILSYYGCFICTSPNVIPKKDLYSVYAAAFYDEKKKDLLESIPTPHTHCLGDQCRYCGLTLFHHYQRELNTLDGLGWRNQLTGYYQQRQVIECPLYQCGCGRSFVRYMELQSECARCIAAIQSLPWYTRPRWRRQYNCSYDRVARRANEFAVYDRKVVKEQHYNSKSGRPYTVDVVKTDFNYHATAANLDAFLDPIQPRCVKCKRRFCVPTAQQPFEVCGFCSLL
jgi:hypothetical protein